MAIDRYEFTKKQTTKKGRVLETTMLPVIEKSYHDRYIFTIESDRLDSLAYEFYGDPRHWTILAMANNLGNGTLALPPGIQLRIPPKSVITTMRDRLKKSEETR